MDLLVVRRTSRKIFCYFDFLLSSLNLECPSHRIWCPVRRAVLMMRLCEFLFLFFVNKLFLHMFRRVKAMIEKQKQSDAAMSATSQGEDSKLFLFLEYYKKPFTYIRQRPRLHHVTIHGARSTSQSNSTWQLRFW
jgi:hypothetical protein